MGSAYQGVEGDKREGDTKIPKNPKKIQSP